MKLLAYLFTACLLGSVLWNCTSGKKDEKTLQAHKFSTHKASRINLEETKKILPFVFYCFFIKNGL